MAKSKKTLSDKYSNSSTDVKASSSKGKIVSMPILIAIAAIIVVAVVVVAVVLLGGKGKEAQNSSYNLVVTSDDKNASSQNVSDVVPTSYDVSMNSEWNFTDARSASYNAYVANIDTNTNPVYFQVKRNDTGAVIYESPDIPVGGHLENIQLSEQTLPKGVYPCTVTYNLLGSNRKQLSHVNVNITITIEND